MIDRITSLDGREDPKKALIPSSIKSAIARGETLAANDPNSSIR
jgi:hypothetical protein